jgi:hypothetical protein
MLLPIDGSQLAIIKGLRSVSDLSLLCKICHWYYHNAQPEWCPWCGQATIIV